MRNKIVVKLELSPMDAHIVTKILEGGGYPHILEQFNAAQGRAYAHRFLGLVAHDLKHGYYKSALCRFKNFKKIREKYT